MTRKKSVRTTIKKAVKICGLRSLGISCGITYQTISGWMDRNKMPDREFSGKSLHSAMIEFETDGQVTIADILGFIPEPQAKELERLKKRG